MNHRNSAPRMAKSMILLALDMGLSSSTGSSIAARRSPSSSSSLISSSILFSLIVKNRTRAEMTMRTDAMTNGSSIVMRLGLSLLRYLERTKTIPSTVAKAPPK